MTLQGKVGEGAEEGQEGKERYHLPDAYNKAVPSGNKATCKYRRLLHTALVLCNSWCGSHCARLGSLQAVDDTALANIRQTWSEIFNIRKGGPSV